MKRSDIEEFKAIAFMLVGVFCYQAELLIPAWIIWTLATISMGAACVIAYYESQIAKLKRKLDQ